MYGLYACIAFCYPYVPGKINLILVNDLPTAVKCTPRLYFMLRTIFLLSNLEYDRKEDVLNNSKWFQANKLTMNASKSNIGLLLIPSKFNLVKILTFLLMTQLFPRPLQLNWHWRRVKFLATHYVIKLKKF